MPLSPRARGRDLVKDFEHHNLKIDAVKTHLKEVRMPLLSDPEASA